jgi:hypothetical protein
LEGERDFQLRPAAVCFHFCLAHAHYGKLAFNGEGVKGKVGFFSHPSSRGRDEGQEIMCKNHSCSGRFPTTDSADFHGWAADRTEYWRIGRLGTVPPSLPHSITPFRQPPGCTAAVGSKLTDHPWTNEGLIGKGARGWASNTYNHESSKCVSISP